jgi:Tol biopolymer transport system component
MKAIQSTVKIAAALSVISMLAATGRAQLTELVSIAADGTSPPNGMAYTSVSITPDGRFVAFTSGASNLVPADTNVVGDVFVRDRWLATTELISISTAGVQGNGGSSYPVITPDGRYVAFMSLASNLVPNDTNGVLDVFVRDRLNGTTERASISYLGNEAVRPCFQPSISDDGRFVAFASESSHLVTNDTNTTSDVFVRDRVNATTELVSVSISGVSANGVSARPSISADGRFVAFDSTALDVDPQDNNGQWADVFVRDRLNGTTELVSFSMAGNGGNNTSNYAWISAGGRYVVFNSLATDLVPVDTNASEDVFVRDRLLGTTERVSVATNGAPGNSYSAVLDPGSISPDGRYVVFTSLASNLAPGDTNNHYDVFVRDRVNATTERVSISTNGVQGDHDSILGGTISPDGRWVAFESDSTNLVSGGTPSGGIFMRDRNASGAASLCDPGLNAVIACPCANAPSGPGRGCDNSSATGGAALGASGIAYLSMDSLVFATSGEKPTATSIVLQGNAQSASGIVFGQGVRCVAGTLKRLYTKTASGGSITAPTAGDPTVSSRSSALGDVISAGQSRWYLVYYRDPIVLGGCPSSSTFNATQTIAVAWSL